MPALCSASIVRDVGIATIGDAAGANPSSSRSRLARPRTWASTTVRSSAASQGSARPAARTSKSGSS